MAFCTTCGTLLSGGLKFCTRCGKAAPAQASVSAGPAPVRSVERAPRIEPVIIQPVIEERLAPAGTAAVLQPGRSLISKVPLALLSFAIAFLVHTYLLVVVNEGFGAGTAISPWIYTSGNLFSSVLIWVSGSSLIWSVFRAGVPGSLSSVMGTLTQFSKLVAGGGRRAMGALAIGAGAALVLTQVLSINPQARILVAVFLTLGSFGALGAWLAKPLARLTGGQGQGVVAGLGLGFVLAYVLSPSVVWLAGIGLLVAGVLVTRQLPGASSSAGSWLVAVIAAGGILAARTVYADDGGWVEAGSTFEGWWNSPGRTEALINSIIAAFGGLLGPLLPPVLGDPQVEIAGKPSKGSKEPKEDGTGPDEVLECERDPIGGSAGSHHHEIANADGTCTWYQCYIHQCWYVNKKTGEKRSAPNKHDIQRDLEVKTGPCTGAASPVAVAPGVEIAGKPSKEGKKPKDDGAGPDEVRECEEYPIEGSYGIHDHIVRNKDGTCTWYKCYIHRCWFVNKKTGAKREAPLRHDIQEPFKTGDCPGSPGTPT
jgi:hypothetical protein